jgi:hypothetical protein
MTGTGNSTGVRTFALRYIDLEGNIVWKKVNGNNENQFWEGFSNSIITDGENFYSAGAIINEVNYYHGLYLYKFDNVFDSVKCDIINQDDIWKKGFNLTQFTNGDFFITGQIYSSELDDAFMYLVKTDEQGNFVWERSYGQRNESGRQIIVTTDSCVLIGGHTFSFPTTVTDEDWYLIKVDTAGNVIWERGYGSGSRYDGSVSGIIETQDSNYIACGGYPAFEAAGNNYFDGCLRKVSRDGDLMWTKYYRSYSSIADPATDWIENFTSSLIYKNDDLFVLGNCRTNIGASRGYLQKITETGDICWNREYYAIDTTSTYQWLTSIKNTTDGGFIIGGYGNEYDRQGYYPPQQAWLVKTDSLGIDGLCYTEPPELNIDIILPESVNCNDTITVYTYIAGKSGPYTIETSVGQVIDSIFYPPKFVPIEIGLSETSVEIGGIEYYSELITEATLSNHEWGQCIAKPVEFYTPHTSGSQQISITVTDTYGESKTIIKEVFVNECGSGIGEEFVNSVNVYPNPTVDNLYLYIGDFGSAQSPGSMQVVERSRNHQLVNCEIYNSLGQLVKTLQLSNNLTVINVKDFASGVYILKISNEDKTYSLSFEKQ